MLLTIENLHKSYVAGGIETAVLRGISLTLERGESLALMGESGSGKSTLLHLIAGLDVPKSGQITLDGQIMSEPSDSKRAERRRHLVGLIFQQFNLIPSLTVAANIAFQAQLAGRHDPVWCTQLAAQMGLNAHLAKYPEALSGGQQQRVAIARALAAKPALVLADEPTGNLDEDTAQSVLALLLEITRETDTSVLMVTHSAVHARALDRQMTLRGGIIAQ
ncbi:MAG: ABC transporter ATP-binding protein [Planktotalea arctica]|uniref:ABC transporter ATP-binding protein n=2 Tax=Planktotalea arctica TaxID=1481893 RepID=UPI00321BE2C3